MAYDFNEDAYYGDMIPMYPSGGGSHGGGGGVTPADMSAWLKKKELGDALAGLSGDPKTLNQTISLLKELIMNMKQCAKEG